jgi:hypothetical protein
MGRDASLWPGAGCAGGIRLASEFISPLDLVAIGLVSAEEAEALVSADSGAV